ncbi:MAG TPA: class I SAM-dependent methyltransferase [Candidatus Onthoplasma faecigallinarum]|nr:class I SAM-dependent methyltransferase [Candidatus Onthoplasma faecigallinarum]
MKIATDWKDYEVLSTANGEKLERIGGYTFLRPDPQVIWKTDTNLDEKVDAKYKRTENKSGQWTLNPKIPKSFVIERKNVKFHIEPMSFKHICLFPEQAVNWDIMTDLIKKSGRKIKVLNLFAYTGAASVECALAGAEVTHVDAAKSMIDIAKINAKLNNITNIRYILDDCMKFVQREIRRGNRYDAIIMDPPSFGRGPKGETWKIEDNIYEFVKNCAKILSERPLFVLINSYTTGLQPTVMSNILNSTIATGETYSYEVGLPTKEKGIVLPCGCSAIKIFEGKL